MIFHIGTINSWFGLSLFLLLTLNIILTWNFSLFPEIVLNSIIKIATRYCYVLLVLSHDQISLLCLIQAFKVSSDQNSKACPHQWGSKFCFDYSHLWRNFLTCGNVGKHNWGILRTYWSNMQHRHFWNILFPFFCVSVKWLRVALKVTRNMLRQNQIPGFAFKLTDLISKITSLH